MIFKLLAINGSLTPPSRTRVVLDVALAGARAYDPAIETEVLELRDFNLEFCDGRAAWNVVTSASEAEAKNFNRDQHMEHGRGFASNSISMSKREKSGRRKSPDKRSL
jgi:NADPH-dependent FMN reductase